MIYALYLSDIGYPPADSKDNWIICRNFDDAVRVVEKHAPGHIYFGADLAEAPGRETWPDEWSPVPDCFDFVRWLTAYDEGEDILSNKFTYEVEPGDFSTDIERIMTRYLQSKTF